MAAHIQTALDWNYLSNMYSNFECTVARKLDFPFDFCFKILIAFWRPLQLLANKIWMGWCESVTLFSQFVHGKMTDKVVIA